MRDSKFQTALRRWLDVLLQLPPDCGIVVQLKQVGDTSHQLRMLRDIFAKKAPQTLLKRCHSFLRFVCHLKDVGETFPGTEQGLYGFLCRLRDAGASTSNLQSVVQALNFAQHVVGLPELTVVTTSRRCTGAVGMRNVGPKRQAHPFTVSELLVLHSVLLDQTEDPWKYSSPHPYTKKQGRSRASSRLSPARRSPPSHLLRPDFRITALPVHASRPMAPGQDHHRHGETEPVGLQVVQTLLC